MIDIFDLLKDLSAAGRDVSVVWAVRYRLPV